MTTLHQIYHVSRCGSTLLTALLSGAAPAASEPPWVRGLFEATTPPDNLDAHGGVVVKLPSIFSRLGHKLPGNKVFLYRPLAQYLLKMNEVTPEWIDHRKQLYGSVFDALRGTEMAGLEPTHIHQLHAIFWGACILEMAKVDNVLWVQSNDLFQDPDAVARKCMAHFGLAGTPAMEFATVDVKSLGLNGQDRVLPLSGYSAAPLTAVDHTHSILSSADAIKDPAIQSALAWAKAHIPVSDTFLT